MLDGAAIAQELAGNRLVGDEQLEFFASYVFSLFSSSLFVVFPSSFF